jgi:MFS family permease
MPPISVNASGTSAALLGGPFSDNDSTGSLDEQALVRVTGKRWWILTIYCCLSWLVGAVWMTFATITEESAIYFGVGESDIQNISALYMLAFVPGAVLMLRFVRHDGIRYCVLACCWFQLGGCVLRSLSAFLAIHVADEPFYFRAAMISGTVLAGVAQPLATSLTARVAAEWFPPGERDIATALGIVTNALGNAGMMGLAPVFISCIKTDAEGVCIAYEGIPLLLLCQLLFTLLILVVALFTFDALPRYPPSIRYARVRVV